MQTPDSRPAEPASGAPEMLPPPATRPRRRGLSVLLAFVVIGLLAGGAYWLVQRAKTPASGRTAGGAHWVGSHRYLEERKQETPEVHERLEALAKSGRSVVVIGNDMHVCGFLALADTHLTMLFATEATDVATAEAQFTTEPDTLMSRAPDAINTITITGD